MAPRCGGAGNRLRRRRPYRNLHRGFYKPKKSANSDKSCEFGGFKGPFFGEIGRCESNRLSWIPYRPIVTWGYSFAQKSLLGFMPPNSQLLSLLSKLFYAGEFYLMSLRTAVRRFVSTSFGRASRLSRSACLGCVRSEPSLNCGGLISAAACLGGSLCFFLF